MSFTYELEKLYKRTTLYRHFDFRDHGTKVLTNIQCSHRIKHTFENGYTLVLVQRGYSTRILYLYDYEDIDITTIELPTDYIVKSSILSALNLTTKGYSTIVDSKKYVSLNGTNSIIINNIYPRIYVNSRLTKTKYFELTLNNDISIPYHVIEDVKKLKSICKDYRSLKYNYEKIDLNKLANSRIDEFLCTMMNSVKNS